MAKIDLKKFTEDFMSFTHDLNKGVTKDFSSKQKDVIIASTFIIGKAIRNAIEKQGLTYKDGKIVEIETQETKFKVGDVLRKKGKDYTFTVDRIQGGYYHCDHNKGAFFPIEEQDKWELTEPEQEVDYWVDFRNKAAIAAMQGVMNFFGSIDYNRETIARLAVEQADALIEELRKEKSL